MTKQNEVKVRYAKEILQQIVNKYVAIYHHAKARVPRSDSEKLEREVSMKVFEWFIQDVDAIRHYLGEKTECVECGKQYVQDTTYLGACSEECFLAYMKKKDKSDPQIVVPEPEIIIP